MLSKIENVEKVTFDTKTKRATLKVAKGKTVSKEACENALKGSRYKVKSFGAAG